MRPEPAPRQVRAVTGWKIPQPTRAANRVHSRHIPIAASARGGFTLIELLIVLVIASLLIGMSTIGVGRALQRSALNRGIAMIQETATEARLMAMNSSGGAEAATYGVVIAWDATARRTCVGLARWSPGDGKPDDASRVLPGRRRFLPPSAVVWLADREFAPSDSSQCEEVAWYYEPCTGQPVARVGDRLSPAGMTVGLPRWSPVKGRFFGVPADPASVAPVAIAPAICANGTTPAVPGLSLRTRDQKLKQAIAIYATGTIAIGGF